MKRTVSDRLFSQAIEIIPGGVNSPVRACKAVGGNPVFIQRGKGGHLTDVDGNDYIDYISSWGPMILGHGHPAVVEAISKTLQDGTSFGAPTALEAELADMIITAISSVEMVRMVNSGTEATLSTIRLARGVTGRELIVKFDGCYHGHADSLLVEAGSGVATLNIAGTPGIPQTLVEKTISIPYNDIDTFKEIMAQKGKEIAAVIVEPVAGNMGLVLPKKGFLETLREETAEKGVLLIFDEVMTGFRVAYGGAQTYFNIKPDLTTLGKVIGGGLPVGAYGGRKEIMAHVAPQGPVYQAGTLSGNPLAMSAGIATLKELKKPGVYDVLDQNAQELIEGLQKTANETGVNVFTTQIGGMLGLFFTKDPVDSFATAKKSDTARFGVYYNKMIEEGIFLPPSQFEAFFMSLAHTKKDVQKTVEAAKKAFSYIKEENK